MISIVTKHLLLALLFCATLLAVPAEARRDRLPGDALWRDSPARERTQERRVSLEQAIASVQRTTGGRVLDAKDLGDQYRIKVLTREGEVRIVRVDARSGAMR
jgi:uncharacterized membrane protein YkoI